MKTISIKDIEGIRIGNAQNFTGGTGCTVILSETGMCAGLDVRGGGPASRESELLKPLAAAQSIHAVLLGGGSAFGLDAAGGVMQFLEEKGIGFDVGVTKVPLVCQSDIFDLTVADPYTRPDKAMGYEACVGAWQMLMYARTKKWAMKLAKVLTQTIIRMETLESEPVLPLVSSGEWTIA